MSGTPAARAPASRKRTGKTSARSDGRFDLQARYQALKTLDSNARGPEAEELVATILRRAHFRVDRNPGIAWPRQTDILASDGRVDYLIEVKATAKRADVGVLAELTSRLDEAPIGAVGVLVSLNGFTHTVPEKVKQRRSQPVLLVGAAELELLINRPWAARRMLELKLDRLRRDGVVSGEEDLGALSFVGTENVAEDAWLVDGQGQRIDWVASGGEFGFFSFTGSYEPVALDSEPGQGQQLELSVAAFSQSQMLGRIDQLDDLGWLTSQGSWCIQQTSTNWHGVGAASLRAALRGWRKRYEGLEDLHYREEVLYVDTCHLGTYSLAFDVAARRAREVWHSEMSIHLPGVPFDPQPYLELARTMTHEPPGFFRGRASGTSGRWGPTGRKLRKLTPLARIATASELGREEGPYVRGVVVANPFTNSPRAKLPEGLPPQMAKSELLVCELGSWHRLADGPATYQITDIEWAWLGEGFTIRVRADWDDAAFERRLTARLADWPRTSRVRLSVSKRRLT